MADTVQQIKEKLSINDVVSQYLTLERAGTSLRARCPFHAEKTPSFFVSPDRGTFHCFGCGVGGDIFSFVEQIEGLDFKGALKVLAERAGVPLVYEKREKKDERDRLLELMEAATIFYMSHLSDEAKGYIMGRGVTEGIMKEFRLGYAGNEWSDLSDHLRGKKCTEKEILDAGLAKKTERGTLVDKFRNRIMFPIADSAGRVIAFSGRIFGENASSDAPKYLNSPETLLFHKSRILYGFDKAKISMRKHACAVLVEGQMDLLMSHQAGWGNTVAVSGTAFTDDHARLIKRMTDNLLLALDPDPAGIKAAARAARAALTNGLNVKVARLKSGLDPADYIHKEGPEGWKVAIREAKDIITFLLDVLEENTKGQSDRFRRSVELGVLPFVVDVQSPIARAQYVKEIAARLGVGSEAVQEAVNKMPETFVAPPITALQKDEPKILERARHAYALLLWQESLEKPMIDLGAYRAQLMDALGERRMEDFDALAEPEREKLRFSVERLHAEQTSVERDARELIRILKTERLTAQLADATKSLEKVSNSGKDVDKSALEAQVMAYTEQLAKLHEKS